MCAGVTSGGAQKGTARASSLHSPGAIYTRVLPVPLSACPHGGLYLLGWGDATSPLRFQGVSNEL